MEKITERKQKAEKSAQDRKNGKGIKACFYKENQK